MPRTTPTLVRSIMNRDPPPATVDLSYYVTTANTVLNELIPAGSYSEPFLGVMETWLAAHYVKVDMRAKLRVQAGPSEDEYDHTKPGDGLKSTEYGKQVIQMDQKRLLTRIFVTSYWAAKPFGSRTCR